MRARRTVLVVVVVVLGAGLAPPAHAAEPRVGGGLSEDRGARASDPVVVTADDFTVMVADEGDGTTRSFVTGDDVEVSLRGNVEDGYLGVEVRPADEVGYYFDFGAERGRGLEERRYEDTEEFATEAYGEHSVGIQGYGCNEARGDFEVHELTADLSRVWISFANTCADTVGEVRIGMSEPDEEVRAVPRRLQWGDRRVGSESVPVDLRFANTGPSPRRVLDVVVDRGRESYRIARTDCDGVLAPGETCTAGVVRAPRGRQDGPRPGRVVLRSEDATGRSTTLAVPMVGDALGGHWGLEAWGDDTTKYEVGPSHLTAYSAGPGSVIDVGTGDSAGPLLDLRIAPPTDEVLVAGRTYEGGNPQDPATRREAEMRVAAKGEVCRGTGRFTVHEVVHDDRGRLDRLALTFVWECWGSARDDIRGTVAVHATQPPPRPGPRSSVALLRGPSVRWRDGVAVVDRRAPLRTTADPAPPWRQGCVDWTLQRRTGTSWRTVDDGPCQAIGRNGLTRHEVPGGRFPAGTRIRLRGTWRAPGFPTVRSGWQRTRVVSRAP